MPRPGPIKLYRRSTRGTDDLFDKTEGTYTNDTTPYWTASGRPKSGVLLSSAPHCAPGAGDKVVQLRFDLSREDLAPYAHKNAASGCEEWAVPAEILQRTFL